MLRWEAHGVRDVAWRGVVRSVVLSGFGMRGLLRDTRWVRVSLSEGETENRVSAVVLICVS